MSKDMKVTIDASDIKKKIIEINNAKSTLNKKISHLKRIPVQSYQ